MSRVKIAFVLRSNRRNPLPSTRIAVLNMLDSLCAANFEPVIAYEPPETTDRPDLTGLAERLYRDGIQVVYFQKVHGRSVVDEAAKASALGMKTVFGVCDDIDNDMADVADVTIVVTDFLKSLYDVRLHRKIHVVHDGIENPDICKTTWRRPGPDDGRLRAVLVTASEMRAVPVIHRLPSFVDLTVVGRYPRRSFLQSMKAAYWTAHSVSGLARKSQCVQRQFYTPFRRVAWHIEDVYRHMLNADIGIIPIDMTPDPLPGHVVSWWQVRSENRLTMKMAVGLPVIASPVPAYADVIEHGVNGFLAATRAEWADYMDALREPALRERIGRRARDTVIDRYSKAGQARALIAILNALESNRAAVPIKASEAATVR